IGHLLDLCQGRFKSHVVRGGELQGHSAFALDALDRDGAKYSFDLSEHRKGKDIARPISHRGRAQSGFVDDLFFKIPTLQDDVHFAFALATKFTNSCAVKVSVGHKSKIIATHLDGLQLLATRKDVELGRTCIEDRLRSHAAAGDRLLQAAKELLTRLHQWRQIASTEQQFHRSPFTNSAGKKRRLSHNANRTRTAGVEFPHKVSQAEHFFRVFSYPTNEKLGRVAHEEAAFDRGYTIDTLLGVGVHDLLGFETRLHELVHAEPWRRQNDTKDQVAVACR